MTDPSRDTIAGAGPDVSILVVDDEPVLCDILIRALDSYQVSAATGGRAAIDMIRQRYYHLVVTDLMMPQVDGFAVLQAAKTTHPTTEVLVITSYLSIDNERRCRELGCSDFLPKPFTVAAVRDKVHGCLERAYVTRCLSRSAE